MRMEEESKACWESLVNLESRYRRASQPKLKKASTPPLNESSNDSHSHVVVVW